MSWVYPVALLLSAAGVATLDARHRLVMWRAPRRALIVLALGFAFFVAWDLAGIALGLFRHLDSEFATGLLVAPHLPIEELVFLLFLCYLTLVTLAGARRVVAALAARREASRDGERAASRRAPDSPTNLPLKEAPRSAEDGASFSGGSQGGPASRGGDGGTASRGGDGASFSGGSRGGRASRGGDGGTASRGGHGASFSDGSRGGPA